MHNRLSMNSDVCLSKLENPKFEKVDETFWFSLHPFKGALCAILYLIKVEHIAERNHYTVFLKDQTWLHQQGLISLGLVKRQLPLLQSN